ncbi:MAG: hypothetical protein CVU38_13615 [Chloroflexi bacterium HGW-Chloroflexi-1]|nr:MAG: hypothetical protein CVU38_13615 [Chloroflexi bacterium HGW-Chloroflexi-1]
MEVQTQRSLKIATCIYGVLVVLVFGSVAISLQAHGDLMLMKTPHRFEWIAGDIMLILLVLWGLSFILSTFKRMSRFFGRLALLLSVFGSVLVVCVNLREQTNVWLGLSFVLILFFLPSLAIALVSFRKPAQVRGT